MSIFQELRRRNVFKVGAAYLVLSWLLIQLATALTPALLLPEWTVRFVAGLLVLGLPVALFFAWAFELTPEGVRRTTEVAPEESVTAQTGKKIEYIIIAGLLMAVAFLLYDPHWGDGDAGGVGVAEASPSIAVLPFEDFSPEKDQEYFSKGIAEEILNLLAKTNQMRVAARTSSFAFAGDEADIRDIGRKLDVATVLEGSIRKAGTTLRITAQLINVEDGYHIWSETYDRDMSDIFAIQDEIATNIMQSLKVHLLGEMETQNAIRAANMDAYDAYLIGKERLAADTLDDTVAAMAKFEEAIAIDPDFAPARVQYVLARLEFERRRGGPDNRLERERETDALVQPQLEAAKRLAPDLPELAAAEGLYAYRRYRNDEAMDKLNRAIALNPNYAQAYLWRAESHYRNHDFKAMLADRETAYRLDPMSLSISRELAYDYRSFWRPEDADRIINRMFELRPGHLDAYVAKAGNLAAHGHYAETIPVLEEALEHHPNNRRVKGFLATELMFVGDNEAARKLDLDWLETEIAIHEQDWDKAKQLLEEGVERDGRAEWGWAAWEVYRQLGDRETLRGWVDEYIQQMEARGVPWREQCDYALIDNMQYLGMEDGLDTLMADCRESTVNRLEAGYLCPCSWSSLVFFAILDGRHDDAVMRAHEWLDKGDSYDHLPFDATFARLKDHPEYETLLRRNADQLARQRRIYQAYRANQSEGGP